MTISDTLLRDIIDASTPEGSNMPYVKAKYLMIGMTIDLGEYFVKLKAEVEDTFMAPNLIDAAELGRIIKITSDEWLDVTGLTRNSATNTITIDTDNPEVPSLRLPEDTPVMVLIGDDSSKHGYAAPLTFADYLDEAYADGADNATTLYNFVYNEASGPNPQPFMRAVSSWTNFHNWLNAHDASDHIIAVAASVWGDYKDTLAL